MNLFFDKFNQSDELRSYNKRMKKFQRIVHFDLKGFPLKVSYLEKVMLMAKSWGASGFLFEWEDTFPYYGELAVIGSQSNSSGDGMYSMEEIQHIFQFARDHEMIAIQLVQTIGHLEFVLKHPEFSGFREIHSSPAVLCPCRRGAQELIFKMIDQALDAQPDAKYFHIGGDEVWHKGECLECKRKLLNRRFQSDSLYLDYIQNLSLHINKKRRNVTVLMWDDMLRSIDANAFQTYDLTNVQPVYWNYNNIENFYTNATVWQKYSKLFPKVWAGSAFKGANGSCQAFSPVARYVSNHDAWLREMKTYKDTIDFGGIILTGWSRYDHYATLCELTPVMLPSLSSCLKLVMKADYVARENLVREILPPEEWPGEELARCVHSFVILRDRCQILLHGDQVATWMNPWQIERGYTVCVHVQSIAFSARDLIDEINALHSDMAPHFTFVTGPRSADEWIRTNITPLLNKMTELFNIADNAMTRDAGVRP